MATLVFEHNEEEVELPDGSSIAEACEEAGLPFACEEGVCGTCACIPVTGGENLTPQTQAEADFLGEGNIQERLACQCRIKQGRVVIRF